MSSFALLNGVIVPGLFALVLSCGSDEGKKNKEEIGPDFYLGMSLDSSKEIKKDVFPIDTCIATTLTATSSKGGKSIGLAQDVVLKVSSSKLRSDEVLLNVFTDETCQVEAKSTSLPADSEISKVIVYVKSSTPGKAQATIKYEGDGWAGSQFLKVTFAAPK